METLEDAVPVEETQEEAVPVEETQEIAVPDLEIQEVAVPVEEVSAPVKVTAPAQEVDSPIIITNFVPVKERRTQFSVANQGSTEIVKENHEFKIDHVGKDAMDRLRDYYASNNIHLCLNCC